MKRAITMRQALADPHLLGAVLSGDSWATWRVFLIAIMGEKLDRAEREIFRRFTGRVREPGERVEEALFLIGRRGGKDRAASVLAAYLAALVDWTGVLARGEKGLVLCAGADTKQASVQRDYIEGVFDASPVLSSLVVNKTADGIELSNGINVEVRAANFRRLRGPTCVAVIATEAAFWRDETSANADTEILNAVRPTLATTGGPLILITTPYSRRGVVWDLYRQHYGAGGDPAVLVVQGTTRDFNPVLSQKVIDRALERDPAAAAAEYLAQFRSDLEAFVAREVVDAAVVTGRHELPPIRGLRAFGFCDPAGGSGGGDGMTLAITHREGDRVVLDCVRERKPPFSPDDVVIEFAATLKSYGIGAIQSDRYAGGWVTERFAAHGIRCEQSAKPKNDLYVDLLPVLHASRIELLDHPKLIAQLCGLERRTARSGKDSIDHSPGAHDDIANAVAGATALALGHQGVVVTAESLAQVVGWSQANKRRQFGRQCNYFITTAVKAVS
jgi:hypothetical protein